MYVTISDMETKKKSLIRNHQKNKDIKLENFHGPVCQTSFKYQKMHSFL